MPFSQADQISQDPVNPTPSILTGGWLRDLSAQAAEALIEHTLPNGGAPLITLTEVRQVGGAVARMDSASTAFSHRSEKYAWVSMAGLHDPTLEPAIKAKFGLLWEALGDCLTGKAYMNFLAGEEARLRTAEGFEPKTLQRLAEIKARYDPEGLLGFGYKFK